MIFFSFQNNVVFSFVLSKFQFACVQTRGGKGGANAYAMCTGKGLTHVITKGKVPFCMYFVMLSYVRYFIMLCSL